jgi:glycerol uptake facilitator-like aquaporin
MSYLPYLAEYLGAFFFILVIISSHGNPLVIAVALALVIFLIGRHSGAHVNPAVSFAMMLDSKLSMTRFLGYVAAQLLGGASAYYAHKLTTPLF